jgi:hypothetical protein
VSNALRWKHPRGSAIVHDDILIQGGFIGVTTASSSLRLRPRVARTIHLKIAENIYPVD